MSKVFVTSLKKQRAFTLIELLVVSTIIIVLSTIGLVSYRQAGLNSRNAKRKADLEIMRQAMMLYKQDTGYYFSSSSLTFSDLLNTLETGEYLSEAESLADPSEDQSYVATCTQVSAGSCIKVTLSAELETGNGESETYEITAL